MRLHQGPRLPSFDAMLPRATFRTLGLIDQRPTVPPGVGDSVEPLGDGLIRLLPDGFAARRGLARK
jgi:hypothetical protein